MSRHLIGRDATLSMQVAGEWMVVAYIGRGVFQMVGHSHFASPLNPLDKPSKNSHTNKHDGLRDRWGRLK